jgi:hypothetical protein
MNEGNLKKEMNRKNSKKKCTLLKPVWHWKRIERPTIENAASTDRPPLI